jgi:hypothetical protein
MFGRLLQNLMVPGFVADSNISKKRSIGVRNVGGSI